MNLLLTLVTFSITLNDRQTTGLNAYQNTRKILSPQTWKRFPKKLDMTAQATVISF